MPIPTPRSDEEKTKFIARCNAFLHKENEGREDKRSGEQINAMCYGQWGKKHSSFFRKVSLLDGSEWERQEDYLLITSAELLRPGIYTGMDGIPTRYSAEVIQNANRSLIGKPIKISHEDKSTTVVGFWSAVKGNGISKAQGIVWHPDGITYFTEHPHSPLSMEADAHCDWDEDTHEDICTSMTYTAGAAVENPAAPSSRVESQRRITLSARVDKDGKQIEEKKMTPDWKIDELTEKEKLKLADPFFATEQGTIVFTKADALKEYEKRLDTLKVPDETKKQMLTVFSKAFLEEGFAIPEMAITEELPEEPPKEPPTTPPTEKPPEKPSGEGAEMKADLDKLKEELENTKTSLDKANKAIDDRLTEDIVGLATEVKTYDTEFDSTKFLESVEDKTLQRKMLSVHLEGIKRVRPNPIALKLSKDDVKKKINTATNELFGSDMEDMFKNLIPGTKVEGEGK